MYSVDAQPFQADAYKRRLNPYQRTADNVQDGDGRLYRIATSGGDKDVRVRPSRLPSHFARHSDGGKRADADADGTIDSLDSACRSGSSSLIHRWPPGPVEAAARPRPLAL